MIRSRAIAALLLLSTSTLAVAQTKPRPAVAAAASGKVTLPPGVQQGPSVEGITEYRFANGLTVLMFPDGGTPTMLVNVTYKVGAADEANGESGMAHLLEHLLFRGTPTTPLIGEAFKRYGITSNGSTAYDRTNYYGFFEPKEKTLDWLLSLEADRMRNANITQADLDAEMTVVRNEMEIGQNKPTRRLTGVLSSVAYDWHPYGRNVIGNRSEVENVPVDRLRAFYDRWYQPDVATVIVAGNFDPSTVLGKIARTLGKIPRATRPLPKRYTVEPAQDGERTVTVRRAGPADMIGIGYHTPGVTGADFAALKVLDGVMGSSPGGRFYKAMVKSGLASTAETAIDESGAPGMISFYAAVAEKGDPARVEAAMLDEIEKIAARPITDAEVAAAKQRIANHYERSNSGNVLGVANGLSEEIGAGDWRLWFYGRDRVAQVTTADVNRVAKTYLINTNRTVARFVPTEAAPRVDIARAPDARDLLKDYKGGKATAAVPMFDTSQANIVASTRYEKLGRGLDIALLPKPSRGGRFEAMLQFRFANDAEAGRYRDAGDMAGDLLIRGTKTLNAEQLAERIDSLGARISIVGSAQSVYLRVRGERENFVPTMQLIADIVRNPAFDEKEFGFVRDRLLNGIRNGGREPGQIADRAMREHFDGLPRWHASAYRSKEEQLAAMTALKLEDVRAFHRDFYGTADGEIAVVGDFDPEVATREFTTLFAGWPSKHPYARMRDPYFAPAQSVRRVFETPDKPNAVLTSQARFRMADNDPDHPALLVAARVFGGGVKGSRLGLRIREREGLSYYVGSGVIINPMDDNATFYMQGTAAPENIPRVEAAMKEELTRFIDKGITPTELADAKAELLSALRDNTTSDGGIAESLRLAMFLKRDPMWDARFVKAVEAVTVADVNAAIRKHLRPSDISYFIAGDFARVARDAKALAATKPPARQ